MKIIVDFARPEHTQVRSRQAVRAEHPRAFGPHRARVEMDDLGERVHAGVRATGSGRFDGMIGHAGQGAYELTLHRSRVRLLLPAGELGAVVLETERHPHHHAVASTALRAGWRAAYRPPASAS